MTLQLADGTLATGAAQVVGVVALAGALAAAAAVAYRWYADEPIQEGLAVLVGLAAVAVYLNTTTALGQVIVVGGAGLFDLGTALVNVTTFLLAGAATLVGRRAGDRLAREAAVVAGRGTLDDVGRLVTAVGRVGPVTLPETIEDVDGYDPVPPQTKAALSGRTLLFPSRLTVAELRDRLRSRLADDYGVGHVDVELADDGAVEYLAVGRRAAGLGPTLAPGTAAVAVRADPPFAAASGDVVELWRVGDGGWRGVDDGDGLGDGRGNGDGDGGGGRDGKRDGAAPERVAVGELRAAAGDVVTVALDEADARALPADARYRLVTRPAGGRADRAFAAVLRAAVETLAAVTVAPDSALVGTPRSAVEAAVVAVQPVDGEPLAVPPPDRPFEAGDVVYAVARPEALRRLDAAASGPESEPSS